MTDEQRERKNAKRREWYARNREKEIARQTAWAKANMDKVRRYPSRNTDKALGAAADRIIASAEYWEWRNQNL